MFKRAFALAVSRVHPRAALVQAARPYHHPAAEIDHGASIGAGVSIGPFCVVSSRAVIGPNCELGPGVHVLGNTTLGAGCVLHSHAVIGADTEVRAARRSLAPRRADTPVSVLEASSAGL